MQRREILTGAAALGASWAAAAGRARGDDAPLAPVGPADAESRQATGLKIGEVTDRTAILWTRITGASSRSTDGLDPTKLQPPTGPRARRAPDVAPGDRLDGAAIDALIPKLQGACPGAGGQVRVSVSRRSDLRDARPTPWTSVLAARDFAHQVQLGDLAPDTEYHVRVETRGLDGRLHAPVAARFRTAPRPGDTAGTSFAFTSCQKATEVDDPEGFRLYDAMTKLDPRFFVSAGDVVYYDADPPRATSVEIARYHWQRMFGFPRLRRALAQVPGYWLKDDHDTWLNDGWPTQPAPAGYRWSYADGLRTFREQVPIGPQMYRTFRWGRTLQVWLTEGRDFRSPNPDPDGPAKSLWGATQRAWLERSMRQSDADWKILLSPTPIVGPDRGNKHDNHANDAFAHEGKAFRTWARQHLGDSFVVLTGDRHWQYHSVHPETGTRELCPGAASDAHARGTSTSPGEDPSYHRFHKIAGGFVHVATSRRPGQAQLRLTIRDVDGAVVHEHELARRLG